MKSTKSARLPIFVRKSISPIQHVVFQNVRKTTRFKSLKEQAA